MLAFFSLKSNNKRNNVKEKLQYLLFLLFFLPVIVSFVLGPPFSSSSFLLFRVCIIYISYSPLVLQLRTSYFFCSCISTFCCFSRFFRSFSDSAAFMSSEGVLAPAFPEVVPVNDPSGGGVAGSTSLELANEKYKHRRDTVLNPYRGCSFGISFVLALT